MTWVVDTCVVIDILDDDPRFGLSSAKCLARLLPDALAISPITYIELAPAFAGSAALQDEFLAGIGAARHDPWTAQDTQSAHRAWNAHIARRRASGERRRPIADLLIGAFASRHQGLVTRNITDFRVMFPDLPLVDASDDTSK